MTRCGQRPSRRQSLLHVSLLPQGAQPEQPIAALEGEVSRRWQLPRFPDGARRQFGPGGASHPRSRHRSEYARDLDHRQRRLDRCLARRWLYAVPRHERLSFEGGFRVPAIAWWRGHIKAGTVNLDMWSHMDWWPTFPKLAGLEPPPHDWKDK